MYIFIFILQNTLGENSHTLLYLITVCIVG